MPQVQHITWLHGEVGFFLANRVLLIKIAWNSMVRVLDLFYSV